MEEELEREVRLYRQKSQGKLNVKSEVPKGENSTMVSESESLLLKAVKNQDLQSVEKLLKEENIDPNSPNNQPFMYSLRYCASSVPDATGVPINCGYAPIEKIQAKTS